MLQSPRRAALLSLASFLAITGGVFAQEIPRFPIVRFKVEGNSLLQQSEVDAAVQAFIGPQRDFGDVQKALEALEERYRQRGYTTVNVILPEQVLERGEVVFKVVEGRLKGVRVFGQHHFDEENIRSSLPTLKVGEPPLINEVSANLRIANENPAKKITLKLKPGDREEDIDADVEVADERPWKVAFTLENTGTELSGKNRLGVSYQHANLWNLDHILTAQYQTSPEQTDDVKVYALSYRVPLYRVGDALDLFVTQSNVRSGIGNTLPGFTMTGGGFFYGGRYTLNLKRHGNYDQQIVFGLDYKAFDPTRLQGQVVTNGITVHPLSAQYNGRWQADNTEISVFGSIARNLPWGSNGRQSAFRQHTGEANNRITDDYTIYRGGLTASHSYSTDWQVRFSGNAQWSHRPLIAEEYFGLGGAGSVRGFLEREIAYDSGLQTSLELYTPELCQFAGSEHRCRMLAFLDNGSGFKADAQPGEKSREHIGSAGFGLRYSYGKNVALQTDYGYVLQGTEDRGRGEWRAHAKLGIFF